MDGPYQIKIQYRVVIRVVDTYLRESDGLSEELPGRAVAHD